MKSPNKTVEMWKNPVMRSKSEETIVHPSGNVSTEELMQLFGAGDVTPEGLSSILGNNGGFCTLSKECMPSCN